MSKPTISVIIPALNEEGNLPHVLPRIPRIVDEIILVDGNSTDRTVEVARELIPGVRVVAQEGRGKGAALRSGFGAAEGDILVMLDADGSTDPGEIPVFVHALLAGADFAKGSRFLHGAGTSDMPFHRRLGNATFVQLVRRMYGGRYTDLCYGYNAFWRDVLPLLELDGDGFEIETMMNIRALRAGLRVVEVPSFEDRRVMGIGRLRTVPDGWRVLRTIWGERRRAIHPSAADRLLALTPDWHPLEMAAMLPVTNGNGQTNGNGHANGNGNGHTNGNGQTNGNGHANGNGHLVIDDPDFAEVKLVAEEAATYQAFAIAEGAPSWDSVTDTYIERLTALIGSVDRAAIARLVEELRAARDREATIYFAGNGGSSATAAHWVNDLGKATRQSGRRPFRVMSLSDNTPWVTALANDEGVERIFAGQLENFGRPGDVVVIVSASGNSPNILALLQAARERRIRTLGLIGFDGGAARELLDDGILVATEVGEYGLVESAHAAIADIVTTCLINDRAPVPA